MRARLHALDRARDPRLGRDVAIKVLPDDVASSPERLARLEREATTVARINNPNIESSTERSPSTRRSMRWNTWNGGARRARSPS
jgi:serine/threonine protein kinase